MRDHLLQLLQSLETELRSQGRWEDRSPPAGALNSKQPFAIDTLDFDQWLQWVLLPRMNELLARQLPLPSDCAMGPMAEEVYGTEDPGGARITMLINQIDTLINAAGDQLN